MKVFPLAALVVMLGSSTFADPLRPDEAPEPMREIARGSWDGRDFVATAGHDGETILLRIMAGDKVLVDNPAISDYTPSEDSSYRLSTDNTGNLILAIRQTSPYGEQVEKTITMRGGADRVQLTGYELTSGRAGDIPDFHCTLDLVAGNALIESAGNAIASPFTGAPLDKTTAQIWRDNTASEIGGCINPG